eukprot:COSAG02_NODE_872_length_16321_cov_6.491062_6_plen_65_part_00
MCTHTVLKHVLKSARIENLSWWKKAAIGLSCHADGSDFPSGIAEAEVVANDGKVVEWGGSRGRR